MDGALDCWVFLSCLEVLHRIEGCCDQAQIAANSSHTVGLWAYATDKVKKKKLVALTVRGLFFNCAFFSHRSYPAI